MRRLALWLALLMVWASASAAQSTIGRNNRNNLSVPVDDGWEITLNQRLTAGTWVIGGTFPVFGYQYEHGGSFDGDLYVCDTPDYAADTCDQVGSSLVADVAWTREETGRRYYVLVITTAEDAATPGKLFIWGGENLGSTDGGASGVLGGGTYAQMVAYANPTNGGTWVLTDDDGTDPACNGGDVPAATSITCFWDSDSSSWLPTGTGSVTGLTNPLTVDLDVNQFNLVDIAELDEWVVFVDDSGTPDQQDIMDAVDDACGGTAQNQYECKTVVMPAGDYTINSTIYLTGDGAAPTATNGEGIWGLVLAGAGGSHQQTPRPEQGTAPRCATNLNWAGPSGDPVIHIHGGSNLLLRDFCIDGVGANVAGDLILVTGDVETPSAAENSRGIQLERLQLDAFETTWNGVLNQVQTHCVRLMPWDSTGDPPYSEQTQIDDFVIRESELRCPRGFLGAQGYTNGVRIENTRVQYSDYGAWAEDTDLFIEGGYMTALPSDGATGDEATLCNNAQASILFGSTSDQQPNIGGVNHWTTEVDCGIAIESVNATTPSETFNQAFTITNSQIAVGGNGQTEMVQWDLYGSFTTLGTTYGVRNGETFEDGALDFDPPEGDYLRLVADLPYFDAWDEGQFQVGMNAQVVRVIPEPSVIRVVDADGDADYDDADLEAALTLCSTMAPDDGCVIELQQQTYTDVSVLLPDDVREVRCAQGTGTCVLQGPDEFSGDWVIVDIEPSLGYPHGLYLHGFEIDGNKQALTAATVHDQTFAGGSNKHRCIEIDDATALLMRGLRVEDMHIHSCLNEGIVINQAEDYVLKNNVFEFLGCFDETGTSESPWTPGDATADDVGCGAWGALQPDEDNQPGRVANGIGIEIGSYSKNFVVEDNVVRYFTKIGIQTFSGADESLFPEDGVIRNNAVSWGASAGISLVHSTRTVVSNNSVLHIDAPWTFGNTAKGIACRGGGRYSRFFGNVISDTGGTGLDAGCECGLSQSPQTPGTCEAIFANNTITRACTVHTAYPAISVNTAGYTGTPTGSLSLLSNRAIEIGNCTPGYADEGAYDDLIIVPDDTYAEHFASDYADNSTTGGIQEAVDACGEGSTTDDQGCVVQLPCGTTTLASGIVVGGLTLGTMQNGINLRGCGAGVQSNLDDQLAGTTLVWGGANGGTMLTVTGRLHTFEGFMLDGNGEAGYGIAQVADNAASSPSGKNTYRGITIYDVLDTTLGAAGWGISIGTTDGSEQNDYTIFDQVTVRDSRHCLQQLDSQAVQNEARMFSCEQFTVSPGINIQRGGMNFDEMYLSPNVANAVGLQIDNCALTVEWEDGAVEWDQDNGTVVRMTDASGLCSGDAGAQYKHRIENVRMSMQSTATTEHTCVEKNSASGLSLIDNIWQSTNTDALRRCDLEFDNLDTSDDAVIHMLGNRIAWNNGRDTSDIAITLAATGGGGNKLVRLDNHGGSGSGAFFAEDYTAGSSTGGIQEAIDACEAALGGVVFLPRGETVIDANGQTSPLIDLPGIDRGDAAENAAVCTLAGNGTGSPVNNTGSASDQGPSELKISNFTSMTASGGLKVAINVGGRGQTLRDFSVRPVMGGSATNSDVVINLDGADRSLLENIHIRDPGAWDEGVGIRMVDSQKTQLSSVFVEDLGRGLWLANGTSTNNSTDVIGSTFRAGATGIYLEGDAVSANNGCRDLMIHGGIIEGNSSSGIEWESDSQCTVFIYGTHFENNTGSTNLLLGAAAGAVVQMFGGRLGGSATYDIARSTAHSAGVGPDVLHGVEIGNDTNVTAGVVIAADAMGASGTLTGLRVVSSEGPRRFTVSGTTDSPNAWDLWGSAFTLCTNASGCDVSLPSAVEGMAACWQDGNGGGVVTLDPNGTETIELLGSVLTGGNAIDSPGARGDRMCLYAFADAEWLALGGSGTWADGGAD